MEPYLPRSSLLRKIIASSWSVGTIAPVEAVEEEAESRVEEEVQAVVVVVGLVVTDISHQQFLSR
jgi:hypothetical protein